MLWNISIMILLMFWLLGIMSGLKVVYLTHLPLFFAIIAILIKIEDDRSGYGSYPMNKGYFKRQLISVSRKILTKLTILSGEKVSQAIISPQSYSEEQPR